MTRAAPDFAEPCFRRVKEAKDAVWVGARIHRTCHCTPNGGDKSAPHAWRDTCDRYPHLAAERNGKPVPVEWVWTSGEPITEAYYRFLIDDLEHARLYRPDSPEANPKKAIDWNTLPPPRF